MSKTQYEGENDMNLYDSHLVFLDWDFEPGWCKIMLGRLTGCHQ